VRNSLSDMLVYLVKHAFTLRLFRAGFLAFGFGNTLSLTLSFLFLPEPEFVFAAISGASLLLAAACHTLIAMRSDSDQDA
jgi:hypothetical protein